MPVEGETKSNEENIGNLFWMFHSLWLAIGKKEGGNILLSLPDTILLQGGEVTKWISTDTDGNLSIYIYYIYNC